MHERGAIVMGWLAKLVAVLAVVGLLGFDLVAIAASHVTLEDHANRAAEAANREWNETRNVQASYDAAAAVALREHAEIPVADFTIAPDGTVQLRLTRTATTLVVQHIGPLEKQADVSAEGEAHTPAN